MHKDIKELIEISRFYGQNKKFVIAGGGNTSFKNDKYIWIKASGTSLENIDESGFTQLDREKVKIIASRDYSDEPNEREQQVKNDLFLASVEPDKNLRPSVKTSLHNLIDFPFVVHLHPTLVNGLLCSRNSKSKTSELFGDDALYISYTDPGYVLFKKVEEEVEIYRKKHGKEPRVIFLENHGVFVGGETAESIRGIYDNIFEKIEAITGPEPDQTILPVDENVQDFLPVLRMLLSEARIKVVKSRHDTLIASFYETDSRFRKVALPFTPDTIVYCKSKYLYVEKSNTPAEIIQSVKYQLERFKSEYGFLPKLIMIKGYGLFAFDDTHEGAETTLDVYHDLLKISYYSEFFGGPRFMSLDQISFIESWEVENYRRKVAAGKDVDTGIANKIIVITGAAQGFGAGIAEQLFNRGANVIIADLNEELGLELAEKLNGKPGNKNRAVCFKTDVADPLSVKELVLRAVEEFGGLDVFISNAGILRAGGLDEMDEKTFSLMTKVNYEAYFVCAKYASAVMKLQHEYKPGYFMDIIQVNSKSGLKGSNKNFAYAGGKFGGIGLTQSFALELMPYNIKVNSICPGNFFDGPLWSDPKNGLFVQYLHAGKVPGARSIEDVKKHYEEQVPAKRGCTVPDVVKAILYAIGQEYETGQAIPVTGGQNMLH
ncbi:MAG: SDR family NAD(P)-dependent oxidoreductase [Bacteroidota bacterium]